MAGMFAGLDTSTKVEVEEEKLGGAGWVKETGAYDFIIKMAYGGQSSGGAYFVKVDLETESGQKLQITEYITSGCQAIAA